MVTETTTLPTAPTAITAGNTGTYNSLPEYYTDPARDLSGFIQDYMAGMMGPGGLYEGYQGPRVAAEDPLMTGSYDMASGASGYADPYVNTGANWQNTGADWAKSGLDYMNTAPGYFSSGAGMITDSYGGLYSATDYLNRGSQALDSSASLAGASSTYDPNQVQSHLNPYLDGVISEISRLGNENLFENLMPNVNSTFTGAGQFGSTRNSDFLNTAMQKTQREILGAQSGALNTAWNNASTDYLNWSKQGLDSANVLNNAGQGFGALANTSIDQAGRGADIGTSLANVGGQVSDQGTAMVSGGGALSDLGMQYGNYGLTAGANKWSDVDNTYNAGLRASTYDQSVLDTAYNDWMSRWKEPVTQAGALSTTLGNLGSRIQPDQTQYNTDQPQGDNTSADILALIEFLNSME